MLCDHRMVSKQAEISHMMQRHGRKVHCDQCGKEFASKGYLKTHMSQHHTESRFQCGECPETFGAKQNMERHVRTIHRGIKEDRRKSVCNECGKTYDVSYLPVHMTQAHNQGLGQFTCHLCSKNCSTEQRLKSHIDQIHNEISCDECGIMMPSGRLKTHKGMKHTPEHLKPYVCKICDPPKGFLTSYKLKNHANILTGAKPWQCDYCTYNCADISNLYKHMKSSHNEQYAARPTPQPVQKV